MHGLAISNQLDQGLSICNARSILLDTKIQTTYGFKETARIDLKGQTNRFSSTKNQQVIISLQASYMHTCKRKRSTFEQMRFFFVKTDRSLEQDNNGLLNKQKRYMPMQLKSKP